MYSMVYRATSNYYFGLLVFASQYTVQRPPWEYGRFSRKNDANLCTMLRDVFGQLPHPKPDYCCMLLIGVIFACSENCYFYQQWSTYLQQHNNDHFSTSCRWSRFANPTRRVFPDRSDLHGAEHDQRHWIDQGPVESVKRARLFVTCYCKARTASWYIHDSLSFVFCISSHCYVKLPCANVLLTRGPGVACLALSDVWRHKLLLRRQSMWNWWQRRGSVRWLVFGMWLLKQRVRVTGDAYFL